MVQFTLNPFQLGCLLTLTVYTSFTAFLMHQSRQRTDGDSKLYSIPVSLFLAEALKLVASSLYVFFFEVASGKDESGYLILSQNEEGLQSDVKETKPADERILARQRTCIEKFCPQVWHNLQSTAQIIFGGDALLMMIPALLYLLQNFLQLSASAMISPLLYQTLCQLKIVSAAVASMWVMKKRYTQKQWACFFLLFVGVSVISTSRMGPVKKIISISSTKEILQVAQASSSLMGIIFVSSACFFGSLAAVYIESKVKGNASHHKEVSLATRNAQIALFSLLSATFVVAQKHWQAGFSDVFDGFGFLAWSTVIVRALGGFLVALVLKYTDSIWKGISSSVAIILTLLIEQLVAKTLPSFVFLLGILMIVGSSITYSFLPNA